MEDMVSFLESNFKKIQKKYKNQDELQKELSKITKKISQITGKEYCYCPSNSEEYPYSLGIIVAKVDFDLSKVEL